MKPNRKLAILVACLVSFSFAVAHGSNNRAQMTDTRSVELPSYAIIDERAEPLISAAGKVGFISSVTGGTLISFNIASGKIISSMVIGQTVGPVSLVEVGKRRLVAVAAANNPAAGHPASVSIVNATSARRLNLESLLVLPIEAQITPATRALLTGDGRFCLIASSLGEPTLFSFNVETGEIVSRLPLLGRPSEVALYDKGEKRMVSAVSAVANNLSLFELDEQGRLSSTGDFSPADARFEEANNPAFSADGRGIYIAASTGDRLFLLDGQSASLRASAAILSPQRVVVSDAGAETELIGVTRTRGKDLGLRGGVTLFTNVDGRLEIKSEFTPPNSVEFSPVNNVAFDPTGERAFVGSASGMLFAFSTETGELESFQALGGELRKIALNDKGKTVAAVRSTLSGDEVVIIGFDLVGPDEATDESAPVIISLKPSRVEQGRLKNLGLTVTAENLTEGASLIVGGVEIAAELARKGKALEARLPKSLFNQLGAISVRIKSANGAESQPADLLVVRPDAPLIERIKPDEVPGPASSFILKVKGINFRASSIIYVDNKPLNTRIDSARELRTEVPQEMVAALGQLTVQVRDRALDGLVSNDDIRLTVFGPRISELKPTKEVVVAGAGSFGLKVIGENFRDDARVEINGEPIPADRIRRQTRSVIRVNVPGRISQDAGALSVVVRNPEGNASEPKQLDAHAPEIKTFEPGQVLAGLSRAKVNLRGEFFRKGARVWVRNTNNPDRTPVRVSRQRVRFRSSDRIVVTLDDELSELLAQPGTLKFQVINPNNADGVPSADQSLEVAGPRVDDAVINPIKGDEALVRLVITGANFRRGAVVELLKDGAVYGRQRTPDKIKSDRVAVTLRAKKLDGYGSSSFAVRVVNPGEVRSEPRPPRREEMAIDRY